MITWLYENEGFTTRKDATDLAQALLDGELIEDVTNILRDGLGTVSPNNQKNWVIESHEKF